MNQTVSHLSHRGYLLSLFMQRVEKKLFERARKKCRDG